MMHKINLQKPFLDLDDQPIIENGKPVILSKLISDLLSKSKSEDSMKMKSIYSRLYKTGEVELDDPDYEFFKKGVKNLQLASDHLSGTVLEEMAKQKK